MKKLFALMMMLGLGLGMWAQDPLAGKRIGVLGDSYVYNHREPKENTWHYKFAQRHQMKYYNYGRNGNHVSIDQKRWGDAMVSRYKMMNDSLDYIIVIAGHNDASHLDSIGIDLFRQKLGELCDGLIERYPSAQIFWFTPWQQPYKPADRAENFRRVVDCIIDVCGSRSIPVFDAFRRGNIYGQSDRFRDIYFQGGRKDRAHLNAKGHDRFLPVAENFLLQYMGFEK